MVFHLPNEAEVRTQVNYTQAFALTLLWNVGLLGMLVAVLFIICYIFKKYQLRIAKNEELKESILTQQERNSTSQLSQRHQSNRVSQVVEIKSNNPKTTAFKVVNFVTSFFFYCFWIVGCLIYLTFYMFGTFGRGTHIDVLSVFVLTLGVVLPTLIWKYKTKVSPLTQGKAEIGFTIGMLVFWLCISVFGVISTKGTCVCYYNTNYGWNLQSDLSVSTQFSRLVSLNQVCGSQQICHLYATLPEDTSTSVFLNAHSGMDLDYLSFTIKKGDTLITIVNSTNPFKMDNVESIGQRYVHSVLIKGLEQNTLYSINVASKDGLSLKSSNYKTLPNAASNLTIKMAIGGDVGLTSNGQKMNTYLPAFNPDVIILGGDTVYDDGMRSCYYSWDNFYSMFEPVYEKLNRLVPLVMSIGNHDVGFDALTAPTIGTTKQDLPLFFVFNPQHSSHNLIDVPPVLERESVHYHIIGPTLHFHLDSGYIQDYKDQIHFIRYYSQNNTDKYLFANYHNPLYPSCTNSNPGSNDMLVIEQGMKYWTPLFDELNFVTSMEHHTHYRKMSKKIKGDKQDNKGTRYIGDGSWGVTEMTCSQQNYSPKLSLLKSYAQTNPNHMWQVTVSKVDNIDAPYQINYTAIDLNGKVVESVVDQLFPLK